MFPEHKNECTTSLQIFLKGFHCIMAAPTSSVSLLFPLRSLLPALLKLEELLLLLSLHRRRSCSYLLPSSLTPVLHQLSHRSPPPHHFSLSLWSSSSSPSESAGRHSQVIALLSFAHVWTTFICRRPISNFAWFSSLPLQRRLSDSIAVSLRPSFRHPVYATRKGDVGWCSQELHPIARLRSDGSSSSGYDPPIRRMRFFGFTLGHSHRSGPASLHRPTQPRPIKSS
ncbi:hypothetical protein NL676_039329 [Syzygium grande]|nr:hypothetical protein NL676_039329 [Syzygium grande]